MRKPTVFLLKNIALISSSRAYYVASHFITLYFVSFYLYANTLSKINKLLDFKLHFIILSFSLSVASGFIINNFYDSEKDKLAKPFRIFINNQISTNSKLNISLVFNILALLLSIFCSYKVLICMLFYQFLIWFYSHKIKKILFLNNLLYTVLTFFPYVFLSFYFKDHSNFLILNGILWFFLLLLSDIFKDFKSAKLDLLNGYKTIPTYFNHPKNILFLFYFTLLLVLFYNLTSLNSTSFFFFYYFFGILFLIYCLLYTYNSKNIVSIGWLGLITKFYILVGVLYLPLYNSVQLLLNINIFN